MPVSARSAVDPFRTANYGVVDLRAEPRVRAGAFEYESDVVISGWHSHDMHELEYAACGVAEVETAAGRYLLPPQQAVWIPAGLEHNTTLRSRVRSIAVFYDPATVDLAGDRARVVPVPPVLREMLRYATRWPIDRTTDDDDAVTFFGALAVVIREQLEHEAPLRLPVTDDPIVAAVLAWTNDHLQEATAEGVCRAVGISPRTLRRRVPAAVGITWRTYLHDARVLRAMALLAEPHRTVLEVATEVGFESPSAFTRAFRAITGDNPSEYRRRVGLQG